MIHLYQIGEDYRKALSFDLDSEEDAEACIQLLGEIEARFEDKARNVVAYTLSLDAAAEALKTEEAKLAAKRRAIENRAERMRQYLEYEMRACQFEEIDTGIRKLKFAKTPWSVEIDEGIELPEEYVRIKREPDKKKLADDLKAGKQIDGVRLVQSERLRIS